MSNATKNQGGAARRTTPTRAHQASADAAAKAKAPAKAEDGDQPDPGVVAGKLSPEAAAALAMAGLDTAKGDGDGDGYVPDEQYEEQEGHTLGMLSIVIERDPMQKIPKRIFEFELPVIYTVFGEGTVSVLEGSYEEVFVPDFDVQEAYDQLLRRYDRNSDDPVRKVWGNDVTKLANELGIKMRRTRILGGNYRPVVNASQQKDHARDARATAARGKTR